MTLSLELNLDENTKKFIKDCIKYSRENTLFTVKLIWLPGVDKPVYVLFKTSVPKTIYDILEVSVFIQKVLSHLNMRVISIIDFSVLVYS